MGPSFIWQPQLDYHAHCLKSIRDTTIIASNDHNNEDANKMSPERIIVHLEIQINILEIAIAISCYGSAYDLFCIGIFSTITNILSIDFAIYF